MPSSLVTTVGGASSNSYVALSDAETYFGDRLYSDSWTAATDDDKTRALIMAARILDTRVEWQGQKVAQSQAMDWPRAYVRDRDLLQPPDPTLYYETDIIYLDPATIPTFIKHAQMEQALALLGADLTQDPDSTGLSSVSVGPISVAFDKLDKQRVMPQAVRDLIAPYGTLIDQSGTFRTAKLVRA